MSQFGKNSLTPKTDGWRLLVRPWYVKNNVVAYCEPADSGFSMQMYARETVNEGPYREISDQEALVVAHEFHEGPWMVVAGIQSDSFHRFLRTQPHDAAMSDNNRDTHTEQSDSIF